MYARASWACTLELDRQAWAWATGYSSRPSLETRARTGIQTLHITELHYLLA